MGRIPDRFLEELRGAIKISEVAGRFFKLRKKSGGEYQAIDDESLTFSDRKGLWYDFGRYQKGGDHIELIMFKTGATFEAAVEDLAKMAGMVVPGSNKQPSRSTPAKSHQNGRDDEPPPHHEPPHGAIPSRRPAKQITETYDYLHVDGDLAYQVCRVEWTDEKGKHKKTFMQRQPVHAHPGEWAWGLHGGEYVRGHTGDWYAATEDRKDWSGPRIELDEVAHTLYRLAELREELAQSPDDRRVIFLPEGERKVNVHTEWGLVATCASGGASHWKQHHAEELVDADVVIQADSDEAGRKGAHAKASSLRHIATRVRVLDWAQQWPADLKWPLSNGEKKKSVDVVDFKNAGGTAAKLWSIIDKLPDWTPQPPESSFHAVRFVDLDKPARELEWLVKKVMTRSEVSIWYGSPGCGKSFLITDCGMSIARGMSWMGQRVRQGLVIYQAGEGGLGLKKRLRAYRQAARMDAKENIPFVLLPQPVNLYVDDIDIDKLIAEIKAWASYYDAPLELVVIDTFSSASTGADENSSKDVGPVLTRCRKIAIETGAHVALVHHTPKAGGSPRGWSGLTGNIDNAIEVTRTDQISEEQVDGRVIKRDIREFVTTKQKDDEDHFRRGFVLKQVVLGRDAEDDQITSCVVAPIISDNGRGLRDARGVPVGYADLRPNDMMIFKALIAALQKCGVISPPDTPVPPYTTAVRIRDWQDELLERNSGHGDEEDKLRMRVKKAIQRACENWNPQSKRLIVKEGDWVWRTDRKVHMIDKAPTEKVQAKPEPVALGPPGDDPMMF